MSTGGESIKAQVVDKIPKRFKELKFGIQYAQSTFLLLT
jgi:DNA-directed RNA polymerase III subunit RPC1